MSIGSVQASGGLFILTDAKGVSQQVDLGTLMLMLNLDRTKNLDDQIAMQLDEIQKRNAVLSELTAFMAECRRRKTEDPNNFHFVGVPGPNGRTFSEMWNAEVGAKLWQGTSSTDPKVRDACWDADINAVKGKIDMLNNDSQMANIKLQNLLEKRNNAFEMATKVMDTNNQSIQAIIRNL